MTKEQFNKDVSHALTKALFGFVALVVLYCLFKIGVAHFALPVEPVQPFNQSQLGEKV